MLWNLRGGDVRARRPRPDHRRPAAGLAAARQRGQRPGLERGRQHPDVHRRGARAAARHLDLRHGRAAPGLGPTSRRPTRCSPVLHRFAVARRPGASAAGCSARRRGRPAPDACCGSTAARRRRNGPGTARSSSRWSTAASRCSRRTCAARRASAAASSTPTTAPLRYAAIADVESCVQHLVSTGVADPARVGCMGRSYGGYLTLAALTTYPDLFAVGIDVCGMSNFATFYEHTEPWIAVRRGVQVRRPGDRRRAVARPVPDHPDRPADDAADDRARRERQQRPGDRGRAGGRGAGGPRGASTNTCSSPTRATSCCTAGPGPSTCARRSTG